MQSINPFNGNLIAEYDEFSSTKIAEIIEEVDDRYQSWRKTTFTDRANLMRNAADILLKKKIQLAELMTLEMGKLLREGIAEIEKCAWVCEYYAEKAEEFLTPQEIKTDASRSFVSFQPIGVILAVMPWNFPFWQVFRFAVPTLMAGNTGILKHSSNVIGCAFAIEKIFHDAGFPKNTFRILLAGSNKVNAIIENRNVKAVTLTGSTPAGKAVAASAGKCLKKTVLELGGSDAYLILEDADIEHAVNTCVTSRMINCGQSCIAGKRFIVVESRIEEFTKLFVEKMKAYKKGNPLDDSTMLAPMARKDLRDELHEQVQESLNAGANCVLGGEISDLSGVFYPTTVLTNVEKGMPAYDEELFGPVAAIISANDEADAIAKANDSLFGLGGAIFSQNVDRATKIAEKEIQAGSVFVNSFVKSDPRLPFGGIKESGYGRELSLFGIREFVNIKTISIESSSIV